MTKAGGNLKCEYVIHTVGPIYNNRKTDNYKEHKQLANAIESVLKIMHKDKLKDISIPAISTGIYGFPLTKCVEIFGKVIREFIDEYPQSTEGKEIIMCNFDEKTTKAFVKGLEDEVLHINKDEETKKEQEDSDEDNEESEGSDDSGDSDDSEKSEDSNKGKKKKKKDKAKKSKSKKRVKAESSESSDY